MTGGLWIALDGMGGDNAPGAVVAGADAILERHPQVRFRPEADVGLGLKLT